MTKALVVTIFQGPPTRHEYYRLTWELMKLSLAKVKEQFNKIYIVCNSFNPTSEDLDWLRDNYKHKAVLMLGQMESHWDMMNMVAKQITEEAILFIDSDTILYNEWTIHANFLKLENADVVSIFDSSGKELNFPVLGDQRRFAPYMCFIKNNALRATDYDFSPNSVYTDSFSKITEQILRNGGTAIRIPDDRGTFNIDGTIFPSIKPTTGYYHLRNWNGALHIITSYLVDKESYERDKALMPLNEKSRLLAWVWIVNQMTWKDKKIDKVVSEIFNDWGIPTNKATEYIAGFAAFHEWLKNL